MRTYCLIIFKPDAVEEGRVGEIVRDFREQGFDLELFDVRTVTRELILAHYAEIIAKLGEGFQKRVEAYFVGRTMIPAIVSLEGPDAIAAARALTGATDPVKAAAGTIRGRYGHDSLAQADAEDRIARNVLHCSDSPEAVRREARLWFAPEVLDPRWAGEA